MLFVGGGSERVNYRNHQFYAVFYQTNQENEVNLKLSELPRVEKRFKWSFKLACYRFLKSGWVSNKVQKNVTSDFLGFIILLTLVV